MPQALSRFDPTTRSNNRRLEAPNRFDECMDDLHERMQGFPGALRKQTRRLILANTGMMVTVTIAAFTAAALI